MILAPGIPISGQRISKSVTPGGGSPTTTWYVRDAQGNPMGLYTAAGTTLSLSEQYVYGSSRLGMVNRNRILPPDPVLPSVTIGSLGATYSETLLRGSKTYELSNHLGNVLVTVSDKKVGRPVAGNSSLISYYMADVRSTQDYYPFGMPMGGRSSTAKFCHEETQDLTVPVVESDLNSGTTVAGNTITQNGIVWKSFNGSAADITLESGAAKLTSTASNNGLIIDFTAAALTGGTTYELSYDITDKSAGILLFYVSILNNGNQPLRVAAQKSGTGRQSLLFTLPATVPTLSYLRISAREYAAGMYFTVDNFKIRKYTAAVPAEQYSENFNTAAMSGVNIVNGTHTWKPKYPAQSTVGLTGSAGAQQAKVTCTNVNESYLETEIDLVGGKSYLLQFTVGQDLATKRLLLTLYSKTGSTWSLTEMTGTSYKGSGDYQLNCTIPAGATALRVSFYRSTGASDDAPDLPYTIDNFRIQRLDTVSSQVIRVCEDDGLDANGKKEGVYRYGFNGKEKSDEIKGDDNAYSFEFREYDPRLARFFSVDKLYKEYPWQSPYAFAANNPVALIDYLGLGPDDPKSHKVQKNETLTSIGKKYGVSIDDLVKLNKIENRDKIKSGQVLSVNPETDFSNNPRGGYQNEKNADGEQVTMSNVLNVGLGFAFGAGKDNMIIKGGKALEQVQNWSPVRDLVNTSTTDILADGKAKPGEAYNYSYGSGNIPSFLERVWNGKEKLVSPIHIVGSFNLSARVNSDGKTMTIAIYDSKTISSLSDNNLKSNSNQIRDNRNPKPFTTQYIRFIWTQPIQQKSE